MQTAFFEIQFGYKIFISQPDFNFFVAHFTENFVLYNFIKYFLYLHINSPLKRQSRLQQTTFINIFSLFFIENKTWCFKWILC